MTKTKWRRRGADSVVEEWEQRGEAGGWDLSTGARANATRLARWCAWAVICAGPLLGLMAWVSSTNAAGTTVVARPRAEQTATDTSGPAGFAELFVAAFVAAGEGDEDDLAAYYPPAAQLQLEGTPRRRTAQQTATVQVRRTADETWSVTVAARITTTPGDGGTSSKKKTTAGSEQDRAAVMRYFQVPVTTQPGTTAGQPTGYVAATLPSEVSAPDQEAAPELDYGPTRAAVDGDTRAETVQGFLGSYLTGTGELDRYLAPGLHLRPVSPAPYTRVEIEQLAVAGERENTSGTRVPADGTRRRLLVQVRATGTDTARTPLSYALTLTARDGRWEVAALDAAPAQPPTTTQQQQQRPGSAATGGS